MDANKTRKRSGTPGLLAFGCGIPFFLYLGGYFFLRLTHELVNYGSFIGGPNVLHGFSGFSAAELIYSPLIFLEELVRF